MRPRAAAATAAALAVLAASPAPLKAHEIGAAMVTQGWSVRALRCLPRVLADLRRAGRVRHRPWLGWSASVAAVA